MAEKRLNIKIGIDSSGTVASLSAIRKGLNLISSAMKAVFRTAVVAGFFALMRVGVGIFNDFKRTVVELGSEFLKLRLKSTETAAIISKGGSGFTDAFEGALQMSRELSTQIGFSTMQIQEGMITAARSGLGLQESLQITGSAMKLAQANGEEFQSTLNDLISTTRAFGVELEDVPQFADALSQAVTSSNVSLNGLFEGLKNVASVASTAFGESKETIVDTTAALMVLNDSGIQSAKAGTRLRAAMQKLMGGTAQTTAVFTKYGANIFQANDASQKYFKTLTNGQRAMADSEEKLNKLKNKQFELVIANRENTDEYRKVQDEINATTSTLGTLEEGLDNVYTQFTLAGGKLKPLSDILTELKDNVPTEVIGRAFGIRGGEAIMRLLKDTEKFKTFKDSVQGAMDASEQGISITDNMYAKFLDTILVSWQRIKNTALSTFGVIADGLFDAIKPILPKIQTALQNVFNVVTKNKDNFKAVFEQALVPIGKLFDKLITFSEKFSKSFENLFIDTESTSLPELKFDTDSGELKTINKEITGSPLDKLAKSFGVIGRSMGAVFKATLDSLKPELKSLGTLFSETVAAVLSAKVTMWEEIGANIAGGILRGMTVAAAEGFKNTFMPKSREEMEREAKDKEKSRREKITTEFTDVDSLGNSSAAPSTQQSASQESANTHLYDLLSSDQLHELETTVSNLNGKAQSINDAVTNAGFNLITGVEINTDTINKVDSSVKQTSSNIDEGNLALLNSVNILKKMTEKVIQDNKQLWRTVSTLRSA